jgi:hypothetical protein
MRRQVQRGDGFAARDSKESALSRVHRAAVPRRVACSPELVRVAFAALILTAASLAHSLQFTPSPTANRFRHLDPKLVFPSPVQIHTNDARTSGG